jgi:AhpC/TSA antioxidant enzyme
MHYARLFRDETGITFPLLVDTERKAYKAAALKSGNLFHIFRRDNTRARARARVAGHKQHQLGKDPFQLGGSFVFGPGNRDLFFHLSSTFGDNADPMDLLAVLQ